MVSIEFILDIAGVFLWGATMIYLLSNRIGKSKDSAGISSKGQANDFDEEMLSQLLKHRSDMAIKRIYAAVMREKQLLGGIFENSEFQYSQQNLIQNGNEKVNRNTNSQGKSIRRRPIEGNKYSEVARLADLGISSRKISDRLKIPKGEIDLLVTLQKRKRNTDDGRRQNHTHLHRRRG